MARNMFYVLTICLYHLIKLSDMINILKAFFLDLVSCYNNKNIVITCNDLGL